MVEEKRNNGPENGFVKFSGIAGKIEQKFNKRKEPFFITTLVVPAKSLTEYPSKYPIYSQQMFCREGQPIEVLCEVQSRFNNGYLNVGLKAVLS